MKLLSTFVLFVLCPFLASATAITNGTITIGGPHHQEIFDFSGPGFSVSGEFSTGSGGWAYATLCSPCTPNSPALVTGGVCCNDMYDGSATVNGTHLGSVYWGDMSARRGTQFNAVGPNIPIDAGAGTYHGSFTFTGTMCGTNRMGDDPRPCIVDLPSVTGSGVVDVTVSPSSSGLLVFQSAVYTFVTPEPKAWMLALLGIVAIVGWRLKSTRRVTSG
jgi:hypothetical protein